MPFHSGLLSAAALAVTVLLTACAGPRSTARTCEIGSQCTMDGTLTFQQQAGMSPAITLSRNGAVCVPLLVAADATAAARSIDGEAVRVTGRALPRPAASSDVLELEYEGRWLHPSICSASPLILYVDDLGRR